MYCVTGVLMKMAQRSWITLTDRVNFLTGALMFFLPQLMLALACGSAARLFGPVSSPAEGLSEPCEDHTINRT